MDLIVDGPSLFARHFYAALGRPKIEPDGGRRYEFVPLQSVTLAMRTLLSLLNPDFNRLDRPFKRMLVAWDLKANPLKNREKKPEQYHEMRELFRDLCTILFQSAHAEHPDYEADDLVATSVYNSPNEVVVVSGDKDLMQLQGPRVRYYDLNQKAVLSSRFILNRWHVHQPSQIAIALAIIGDPTDRIEGVPGWGEKRVQKLFETVSAEADFEETLDLVAAQIPESLQGAFWSSLDRTLLERQVPGVPEPAPIELAEPEVVESLELDLDGYYEQIWRLYTKEPF